MNLYRITYYIGTDVPENTETQQITERSEKDARKYFKSICKNGVITDVELVSENTYATKQQERDTLAKIREMVEELGPESYLKTAFKGAFEDAEQNIEDDAAYCQYDRAELAEQRVKELEAELEKANKGLNAALDSAASYAEQIEACEAKLKKQTLPPRLFKMLWMLVADTEEIATNHMAQEAELMAGFAEHPTDIAFTQAVEGYRKAREKRELCAGLLKGLEPLEPEDGEATT